MNALSFRTQYPPFSFDFNVSYHSKMLFVGSCFTENIGSLLEYYKFSININPFGIIYNPLSLADALNIILLNKELHEKDLVYYNEYWHSFKHHGKFSDTDKFTCLNKINEAIKIAHDYIKNIDVLFITFGTAWVYKLNETGQIVANCHKFPANNFQKECLPEELIVAEMNKTIVRIRKINKDVKIVFSLSPVRHLKDGFAENSLSKAILRTAIEKIKETNKKLYYFPAFEIINDDLRDYRFYDTDLVHPADTAKKYVFNYFSEAFFDSKTKETLREVKKILDAKNHRLFNLETRQSKKFIANSLRAIERMEEKYSFIDMSLEKNYFVNLEKRLDNNLPSLKP